MNCKQCGVELPAGSNPRQEFCKPAHRQKYFREQHKSDQNAALVAELAELRAKVTDQARTIEEYASKISRLCTQLNVEERYLSEFESKQYAFKSFLRDQPEKTPLMEKLIADQFILPRLTREKCESRLKRHHPTDNEQAEFTRLWKLMLLSHP